MSGSAGKRKSATELELETAHARITTLLAENAGLRTENANLKERLSDLERNMNTVTDGHIESDKKFEQQARVNAAMDASLTELKTGMARLVRQMDAGPAPRGAWGNAPGHHSPATTVAHAPYPRLPAPHQPQRHTSDDNHKVVFYASPDNSADDMLTKVTDIMGVNRSAIHHVQKIQPGSATRQAPVDAAPSTSAAGGSSSGPQTRNVPANAVFVFSTSKYIADQAIKGNLRKLLREKNMAIYVDDYLSREEKEERRKRAEERQHLKAAGVKAAWRRATLWQLVKEGENEVWKLVPAPTTPATTATTTATT
jgi:hypothetical protein